MQWLYGLPAFALALLVLVTVLFLGVSWYFTRRRRATLRSAPELLRRKTLMSGQDGDASIGALQDEYHDQGLSQARVSFWFSILFASLGFFVIVASLLTVHFTDDLGPQRAQLINLRDDNLTDVFTLRQERIELDVKLQDEAEREVKRQTRLKEIDAAQEYWSRLARGVGLRDDADLLRISPTTQPAILPVDRPPLTVDEIPYRPLPQPFGPESRILLDDLRRETGRLRALVATLEIALNLPGVVPAEIGQSPSTRPQLPTVSDLKTLLASLPTISPMSPPIVLEQQLLTASQVREDLLTGLSTLVHHQEQRFASERNLLTAESTNSQRAIESIKLYIPRVQEELDRERKEADELGRRAAELRAPAGADEAATARYKTIISVVSGAVTQAVAALFFVQSNRARKLMSDFFDRLRMDRKLQVAMGVLTTITDPRAQARTQAALVLSLCQVDVNGAALAKVLEDLHAPTSGPLQPPAGKE